MTIQAIQTRRGLLRSAAAMMASASAALLLPACATTGLGGAPNLAGVLKDLLRISSERAFARLVQPGGFVDDELVRLDLPPELSGSRGALAALLAVPAVRSELLGVMGDAAGAAAKAGEPIVDDAISRLTFADAAAVLRGGPQAATGVLQSRVGDSLTARIVPSALGGLRTDGTGAVLPRVLTAATGFDVQRLAENVGQQAAAGIFRAIGREEAAIRADPRSTGNPALIAALALLG